LHYNNKLDDFMTRIDFYILAGSSAHNRERFACRLTEKAYKSGVPIFLRTENSQQSQRMDELLWTFRQGSFIPHGVDGQSTDDAAVMIGEHASNDQRSELLMINLASDPFQPPANYVRVAELVDDDAEQRQKARERYRQYRAAGHEVNTHEVRADR
jgi:DNA polymerase-3 subunit chi